MSKSYNYEPEHEGICDQCKKETTVARRMWKPNQIMPMIISDAPLCTPCFDIIKNMVK